MRIRLLGEEDVIMKKRGQRYFCSKCEKVHKDDTDIGRKHREYRIKKKK